MLTLRKGPPPYRTIELGGGASITIRPATTFEVDRAGAAIAPIIDGLINGQQAAAEAAILLGAAVECDAFDETWRIAAMERLALIELTMLCTQGWSGMALEDGTEAPLTREYIALLLQDRTVANLVKAVVNAGVHELADEGNESPVSRNGAAAAGESIAPTAEPSASPAPAAV